MERRRPFGWSGARAKLRHLICPRGGEEVEGKSWVGDEEWGSCDDAMRVKGRCATCARAKDSGASGTGRRMQRRRTCERRKKTKILLAKVPTQVQAFIITSRTITGLMTALCVVLSPRVLLLSRLSTAASLHRRLLPPVHPARARHTHSAGGFVNNNKFHPSHPRARQHPISSLSDRGGRGYVVAAASSGGSGSKSDGEGEGGMNDFGNFNKVASSVAAERNKEPIADVLVPYLKDASKGGVLVELACGTGQHAAHLAPLLPQLTLQPTDLNNSSFDAVLHYAAGHANVSPPLLLDASSPEWAPGLLSNLREIFGVGAAGVAAVLVVNMVGLYKLNQLSPYIA
jgi:hypothetical protein